MKLPDLVKIAKVAIDKEMNELKTERAKTKDHKAKGNLLQLEQDLKTMREALKKKDSMNFFGNKHLF